VLRAEHLDDPQVVLELLGPDQRAQIRERVLAKQPARLDVAGDAPRKAERIVFGVAVVAVGDLEGGGESRGELGLEPDVDCVRDQERREREQDSRGHRRREHERQHVLRVEPRAQDPAATLHHQLGEVAPEQEHEQSDPQHAHVHEHEEHRVAAQRERARERQHVLLEHPGQHECERHRRRNAPLAPSSPALGDRERRSGPGPGLGSSA